MKEIFEHEGKKYILIEGNGDKGTASCNGCSFAISTGSNVCSRWNHETSDYAFIKEHKCEDRTDIFVLMPTPGPKKKLEL